MIQGRFHDDRRSQGREVLDVLGTFPYSSLVLIFSFQVVSSQDRPGYQSASHDNPGSEFRSFRTLIATFLSSERNRVCRDGADEA